jgi:hypothetical protein
MSGGGGGGGYLVLAVDVKELVGLMVIEGMRVVVEYK